MAALALVTIVAAVFVGGERSRVPGPTSTRQTLLWLSAPRDLGRLPSRDTWCTLGRTAEHCWLFQEASGDATDTGDATTLWPLVPESSPRQNVASALPVDDASGWVDTTSERSVWSEGAEYFRVADPVDNLPDATNVVSISLVVQNQSSSDNARLFSTEGTDGYAVYLGSTGTIKLRANGTSSNKLINTTEAPLGDNTMRCVTAVLDGRTAGAAAVYVDGATMTLNGGADLSGTGSWRDDTRTALMSSVTGGSRAKAGVLRARVDFAALTLANHQAICGTLWQAPSTDSNALTKLAPADVAWTQTGGARCYAASATTAICVPGGLPGYAYSAGLGTIGWPVEPDRTNRVLSSLDLAGAQWTGGIDAAAVAPDGSKTAATVSVTDASTLSQVATGYGASASLSLRLWAKCSTGTLTFATNGAAAGDWDVDCSTVAGAWTELHSTHASVTENTAWQSAPSGDATLIVTSDATGVTADLWIPTLTATAGLSVIGTAGAAVATGGIAFEVDNDPATYYAGAKGKITLLADWVTGGCVDITDGSNTGRQFGDAADWLAFDSSDATAYICNLALSGKDEAVIRWNSGGTVGSGLFAQCLLNDAAQTWDSTPSTGWTSADPTTIKLDGYAATSCTAVLQTVMIEDTP